MRFDIMTLFPQMVGALLEESIIGRGQREGLYSIAYHNIRDFSEDKHRRVDDMPYGGGTGMVMEPRPIYKCYRHITEEIGKKPHVIYLSPQGRTFNQQVAKELLGYENITLLCGHYEGVDQRILDTIVDEEISLGDFVLTGGEIPAAAVVDCVCRMIPGVLAAEESFTRESHYNGLLEHPQYTRPPSFLGKEVPEVLLSGHHANIEKWRREQSIIRTLKRRPDLLKNCSLTLQERQYLADIMEKTEKEKEEK
jgi:tRNA (guanine37-N1)-methyltransferase